MAKGRKTGGRSVGTPNKNTAPLKVYAGQFTQEAINSLVSIARNVEYPPQARVSAWREVLDRAEGKPVQAMSDPDGKPLSIPQAIAFLITKAPGADCRD